MKSGSEYLNSLEVTKINTERETKTINRPPSVVGHMGNETNLNILREQNTRRENKEQNIKKETTDKTTKKRKAGISFSPKPCTSGLFRSAAMERIPITEEDDSDNSDIDDVYDDVSCCICKQARTPEFINANYLVIKQWTQCDTCGHWTHLKFCSTVSVVRNDIFFEYPHCNPSTSIH